MTALHADIAHGLRHEVATAVGRFAAFLETGDADEGLLAPDVFADVTLPQWRVQVEGADAFIAVRRRLHGKPGKVHIEKVVESDGGFTVKLEERWEDGESWYCREAFLCDLDEQGRIREIDVYCTGDWDEALVAHHAEHVTLVRP